MVVHLVLGNAAHVSGSLMADSLIMRVTWHFAPEFVGLYSNAERRLSTFRDRVP